MKAIDLKKELNNKKTFTENGATAYATSGKCLLDLNFSISNLRFMNGDDVQRMFMEAYEEEPLLALKWLFFLRDCRQGCGERKSFREIIQRLSKENKTIVKKLVHLIPEYGRYDDLLCLLDTPLKEDVLKMIKEQLDKDIDGCLKGECISLLAKWLPSINASSKDTKRYASIIIDYLYKNRNMPKKIQNSSYRALLSKLRKHLKVVERDMSANKWQDINYEYVPSKANLKYSNAFLKHDSDRRLEYLSNVMSGDKKMNSSTNFPSDIVHKYTNFDEVDDSLELLWKNLPDYVKNDSRTIVVADGSGSMYWSDSSVTPIEVATSLAIYFGERASGEFKDRFITFSENPRLVDLRGYNTLYEKINAMQRYCECSNTNIEAVFDLILNTAINNDYTQEELPNNILILSDMQFDNCSRSNKGRVDATLFENIANRYKEHGYKLPRLVFWNILGNSKTIPIKENECGVALVSGYSPAIMQIVLSGELDPYKCLIEQLNSDRYLLVEEALKKCQSI